ncbi:RimK family alpha-L-glutamate ligase [Streptomyces sp. NPDC018045]|uniref:RimK family alpha-L-glutamate ligase n=1 Tax=Streptomyces sp. NPDC018045 TaxID=3365037 RepID=UPI00378ACA5F
MTTGAEVLILDAVSVGLEEQDLLDRLADHRVTAHWCDESRLGFAAEPLGLWYEGRPLPLPAVVLVRSRAYTRAADCYQVFDCLRMLEAAGTTVLNTPDAIQRAHNKLLACALLARAGVPVPPTRAIRTVEEAGACLRRWRDVVFKPALSHSKVGLVRTHLLEPQAPDTPSGVSPHQEIQLWHLLREHRTLCAQPYIAHDDEELRVLVINGAVVSCTARTTLFTDLDGQASHIGYEVSAADLTPALAEVTTAATRAFGLHHAAVDLLNGPKGPVVLEVNPVISMWRDLDAAGLHLSPKGVGAAVAGMVADHLRER